MECPVCAATLIEETHESIPHGACPARHGIWLEGDKLVAAVHSREADRSEFEESVALRESQPLDMAQVNEVERACPVCKEPMQKRNYAYESGVLIDLCDQHGVWLDAGELQRIEAWYEGNEALLQAEKPMWRARLDIAEREFDHAAAQEVGQLHFTPFRRLTSGLASWWYARDDADRRHH